MPLTTLERNPNKQANISSCVCCHLHVVRSSGKSRNGGERAVEGQGKAVSHLTLCRCSAVNK